MSNLAVTNDFIEKRSEIINGREYLMAAPSSKHLWIAKNIYGLLDSYLKEKTCEAFFAPADVKLDEDNIFQPDLLVLCDKNMLKDDGVHGAPDLVVEILSPSTAHRDKMVKKDTYEKFGVREYWIVNPKDKSIEVYGLAEGRYKLFSYLTVFSESELERMDSDEKAKIVYSFNSIIFPEMVINVEDIFKNVN